MKKITLVFFLILILLVSSTSFASSKVPDPIKIDTLIYRLASRAHLYRVVLDEPEMNSVSEDGKGFMLFSDIMITYDGFTSYVKGATMTTNTTREDAASRFLLLLACMEISDSDFYKIGQDAAIDQASELYDKSIEALQGDGLGYLSPSGYTYLLTDQFDIMIFRDLE